MNHSFPVRRFGLGSWLIGSLAFLFLAGFPVDAQTPHYVSFIPVGDLRAEDQTMQSVDKRFEPRALRYWPEKDGFVLQKVPKKRFNRALYGENHAFRVDAGDLPQFGFYGSNGMMGNVQFALQTSDGRLFRFEDLICDSVVYRDGRMCYDFKLPSTDAGIRLIAASSYDRQGAVFQLENVSDGSLTCIALFGAVRGRKLSRNGDLGADPENAMAMQPEYSHFNRYQWDASSFVVHYLYQKDLSSYSEQELYQPENKVSHLFGCFPTSAVLNTGNALLLPDHYSLSQLEDFLHQPAHPDYPLLYARWTMEPAEISYCGFSPDAAWKAEELPSVWQQNLDATADIQSHLTVHTPDPFIDAAAKALAFAADAIWESPVYQHGAVGWRVPLAGWRGAYTGDALGWHDRARTHFKAYAASQMTVPTSLPLIMDTALNLARAAHIEGTPMYSDGYIARTPNNPGNMTHYDMNMLYVDELLRHLQWTGDLEFAKEVWPLLVRHLAWEKRNFDADGDGLYDAYCCIWASDALQYSGGGVTHSSACHYYANLKVAELADLIGEDSRPYLQEAAHIRRAIQDSLWLDEAGHWAEYQDILGDRLRHPSAGTWSIFHPIDSHLGNPLEQYQALRYVDTRIPHIEVLIDSADLKRLSDSGLVVEDGLAMISSTDWMPYIWSVNNVAFGDVMHTALSYFQGHRPEEGFRLMKSVLMDGMYLGASPGNVGQISFYDAARTEMYRDFADPVGVYSRCFVEGLFGIEPDLLHGILHVRPSWPVGWEYASIDLPELSLTFEKDGQGHSSYHLESRFAKPLELLLELPKQHRGAIEVTVNGKTARGRWLDNGVECPKMLLFCGTADEYDIVVRETTEPLPVLSMPSEFTVGDFCLVKAPSSVRISQVADPQGIFASVQYSASQMECHLARKTGDHTFFVELSDGLSSWWQPVDVRIRPNTSSAENKPVRSSGKLRCVDLNPYFNEDINHTFEYGKYMSPRPQSTALQQPTQGFGDWCGPTAIPHVDDSGLRQAASPGNLLDIHPSEGNLPSSLPFATPCAPAVPNVVYVSQYDNYPKSVELPLRGKASHAYLLMAGTTNHQQCRMVNGIVRFIYTDGTADTLALVNPETWVPVEQDYYQDGHAFHVDAPHPYRLRLSDAALSNHPDRDWHLGGIGQRMIDGGAAVILDLPLNPHKKLKSLQMEAVTIESVIGLMSLTLEK